MSLNQPKSTLWRSLLVAFLVFNFAWVSGCSTQSFIGVDDSQQASAETETVMEDTMANDSMMEEPSDSMEMEDTMADDSMMEDTMADTAPATEDRGGSMEMADTGAGDRMMEDTMGDDAFALSDGSDAMDDTGDMEAMMEEMDSMTDEPMDDMSDDEGGLGWWWLLILMAIGAAGYAIYRSRSS